MEVNTDSVAILTKQVLMSEVEVLKSRLDTPGAGPGYSRYIGDVASLKNAITVLEKRIAELEGKVDG